jgi:hypothetical protein
LLANGEVIDAEGTEITGAHSTAMARLWPTEEITLGSLDGEDELGFSWQDCDGCGSSLGGDRYAATAWVDAS